MTCEIKIFIGATHSDKKCWVEVINERSKASLPQKFSRPSQFVSEV
jgi:hypothetical protein